MSPTSLATNPILTNAPARPMSSEKLQPQHLERLAMVYVRQSTPQQLVRHQESTQIQYSLKVRAKQLGWPEERILIVDDCADIWLLLLSRRIPGYGRHPKGVSKAGSRTP